MKGAKYVATDFGSPQVSTTSTPVYTSAESYRDGKEGISAASVYTASAPKRNKTALFVAAPLALAVVVGGAMWLGSDSRDAATDDGRTLRIAEADAPSPSQTPVTAPVQAESAEIAQANNIAPTRIPTPTAAPAPVEVAAAAPRARVAAPRPAAVEAPTASDSTADVSATETEPPAAPIAYSDTGPAAAPAPVTAPAPAPAPAPALLNVEPVAPQ